MKRKRYLDRYDLGRSSTVPYVEGEAWNTRHARRKAAALERQKEVELWCTRHKWRMAIKNDGHHWIFYTHQSKTIEWYPSSGKFVIGKKWDRTFHCHDVDILLQALEATL